MTLTTRPMPMPAHLSDAPAVAELFMGVFRHNLLSFFPGAGFGGPEGLPKLGGGPGFRLLNAPDGGDIAFEVFGSLYRLTPRPGMPFTSQDRRMALAVGTVLDLQHHHLFRKTSPERLELFQGGSEDHYVAAFVEPKSYTLQATRPSRIASTIQTLRTAALSTYENHRVSTGALLVGPGGGGRPTAPDALAYGVELTALKSLHRLCDGRRTLFLVDPAGRLAEIVDVKHWADSVAGRGAPEVPCARAFAAHARATQSGGHVCLVLSRHQEIKLFAGGVQMFAFAHGRWRILDPAAKFAVWRAAVADEALARRLFQAALDLAEERRGGLFVVVDDPAAAIGRLIAPHDALATAPPDGPPPELTPHNPLARRALHYLARDRTAADLDPSVLEALASLDGAVALDREGRLLAFGAILRHDPADLPPLTAAEGARTTAALAASHFGPALKVSEDGIITCYLAGARAWDL